MTASQDTRQAPQALPVPGEKLDTIKDRLITMYPIVVPGSRAEIPSDLWELREYAKSAAAQWEQQAAIADLRIRQQMGTAELATVDGRVVLKRHQDDVKPHHREAATRDYLKPSNG